MKLQTTCLRGSKNLAAAYYPPITTALLVTEQRLQLCKHSARLVNLRLSQHGSITNASLQALATHLTRDSHRACPPAASPATLPTGTTATTPPTSTPRRPCGTRGCWRRAPRCMQLCARSLCPATPARALRQPPPHHLWPDPSVSSWPSGPGSRPAIV